MLDEDDLDTEVGHYLKFQRMSGSTPVEDVEIVVNEIVQSDESTVITITPAEPLMSEGTYRIIFEKWTVKEFVENEPSGTLFEGDTCTFEVFDYIAPMASLTPAKGAQDITPVDELVMTFNDHIQKGAGVLTIRRLNGQIFDQVSIDDCEIDEDKLVLTIPLQEMLEDFTWFYVQIPEGFVTDTVACAYNKSMAYKDSLGVGGVVLADWWFSTADLTPPALIVDADSNMVGLYPVPGSVNIPMNSDLVITLDENITIDDEDNAGIVIYHDNGDVVGGVPTFGNAVEFIPWSSAFATTIGDRLIEVSGSDPVVGLTADVITINPNTVFDQQGMYYVRVSGDDIFDGGGNAWSDLGPQHASMWADLNQVTDREWTFTITSDEEPTLFATDPMYDGVNDPDTYELLPANDSGYVMANLTMIFKDGAGATADYLNVEKVDNSARKVRIYEYYYNPITFEWDDKLWIELPITDPSIVANDSAVTIMNVRLRDDIQGDSVYYVTVDNGAIKTRDIAETNYWAGIDDGLTWRFQTGADDVFVAGGYDILSPNTQDDGDAARNLEIDAASTLAITFQEGIEALAVPTGMVQVWDMDVEPDTLVEEVLVTQAMIEGATLTVPVTMLYDETNFYVILEEGAFADTSTNPTPNTVIGGDDETTGWIFHTGDNTPPVPNAVSPVDGDDCILASTDLVLTFNESHGVATSPEGGTLSIYNADSTFALVIPMSDEYIDSNVVTVPVVDLPDTTLLTVTLSTGALVDGDAHSPLPNPVYAWSFTTGENTKPTVVEDGITPVMAVTADTVLSITFSEPVNTADSMGVVTVNGVEVTMTSDDAITYTAAITDLPSDSTVTVIIAADAFMDVNAGCTSNGNDSVAFVINVADIIAPTAIYAPDETTLDDYVGINLEILFDDEVAPVEGTYLVVYTEDGEFVDSIEATSFTTTDNMSFVAPANITTYDAFYVLADAGSFTDETAAEVGQDWAGIVDVTEWTFDVVDDKFEDDCYTIISPLDDATGVPTSTNLVIEFCERIVAGVGNVYIADLASSAGDVVIPVVDSLITDMKTLTIPVSGLGEMVTYTVTIDPGAITDEAGNEFPGIIDGDEWNFTTIDETDPVVSAVAATVYNGTEDNEGTAYPTSAQITRDEVGPVYLVLETVAADEVSIVAAIAAGNAIVGYVNTPDTYVTVSTIGLTEGNYRAVAIDAYGNVGESTEIVVVMDVPYIEPPVVIEPTVYEINQLQPESPTAVVFTEDSIIATYGVVTGVGADGFFMQDANAEYSGIYVYIKDANTVVPTLGIGTGVKVTGKVKEYYDLTEMYQLDSVQIAAPVVNVEPVVIFAGDIADEKYESVLVTVENLECVEGPDTYGEWVTERQDNQVKIDEQLFAYDPTVGQWYHITGVLNYTWDEFKVAPRMNSDIVLVDNVTTLGLDISVYPNPFNEYIGIKVSSDVQLTKAVISNIAGQLVKEVINPDNTIRTSELSNGVYFISLHTEKGIVKTQRIIKR